MGKTMYYYSTSNYLYQPLPNWSHQYQIVSQTLRKWPTRNFPPLFLNLSWYHHTVDPTAQHVGQFLVTQTCSCSVRGVWSPRIHTIPPLLAWLRLNPMHQTLSLDRPFEKWENINHSIPPPKKWELSGNKKLEVAHFTITLNNLKSQQ